MEYFKEPFLLPCWCPW